MLLSLLMEAEALLDAGTASPGLAFERLLLQQFSWKKYKIEARERRLTIAVRSKARPERAEVPAEAERSREGGCSCSCRGPRL